MSIPWEGEERRKRLVSHAEMEALAHEISKEMKSRFSIPSELHKSQHDWIQVQIEREKCRHEACQALTRSVIQWSVLGILGALAYFFSHGKWPP